MVAVLELSPVKTNFLVRNWSPYQHNRLGGGRECLIGEANDMLLAPDCPVSIRSDVIATPTNSPEHEVSAHRLVTLLT